MYYYVLLVQVIYAISVAMDLVAVFWFVFLEVFFVESQWNGTKGMSYDESYSEPIVSDDGLNWIVFPDYRPILLILLVLSKVFKIPLPSKH